MTSTNWKSLSKKYPNQWVALDKKTGKVFGSGKTAKTAYEQSQKKGLAVPLITKVPKEYGSYILTSIIL